MRPSTQYKHITEDGTRLQQDYSPKQGFYQTQVSINAGVSKRIYECYIKNKILWILLRLWQPWGACLHINNIDLNDEGH